jgi:pyruvate dehydrogenase E2 component (dihydrolipoamide acetyltransferase)
VSLPAANGRGRVRASPAARRLAEELGVEINGVQGTGPGGAVTRDDVREAARAVVPPIPPAAEPAAPELDRVAAMKAAIATSMARSKREIPHYYLSHDIDMQRALAWLREENLRRPVEQRLLPAALLLKATALAVANVPEMNGHWLDGAFRPGDSVNLGVAISLRGGGLVAPAILGAETLDLGRLMAALSDLVARARTGKLRSSEVSEATITVTNLGEGSATAVFGVIYPPQVALVGFGSITERPVAIDGMLGVRPVVTATLAADHRASVGHRGGIFLARLSDLLQKPEEL